MSTASSTVTRKVSDVVSDQFPAGLRVLIVDDDPTCLKILEKMLRNCLYEVTKCQRAEIALSMLRESKNGFDIVISDVHMPDMDGFKLLEHIGLEMDLPVIMMSVDDGKDVVMKGITHGACDYLIKPIRIEAIKNIWQHVVRKKGNMWKELEQSGSMEDCELQQKLSEDTDYASSANEGNWRNSKRRKDEEDEGEERDDSSTLKKPRVVWSVELHQQFVAAVNHLGVEKAVPKKILELMNVPGLTRENVASHLQKYRLYLRRLSGAPQHQSGLATPFMNTQEANFGSVPSFDGIDLQALAVSGQIPPQSLAALQAGLGRSTGNSGIGVPLVDQRNFFSPEMSKLRFGAGQQLNNGKQVNLLHGIPTSMEPKHLAHLHQSVQSVGSMGLQARDGASSFVNLPTSLRTSSSTNVDNVHGKQGSSLIMPMAHPRSRGQVFNEIAGVHSSGLQSPIGQQIVSNQTAGRVLGKDGAVINGRSSTCNSVPQVSTVVDFPVNNVSEWPNGFPSGSAAVVSHITTTGGSFQERGNLEIIGSSSFVPGYDIFNELRQAKPQEWELQSVDSSIDTSQLGNSAKRNLDLRRSILSHQALAGSQTNNRLNNSAAVMSSALAPQRKENEQLNPDDIAQRHNNLLADSSFRVKAETLPDLSYENYLFAEQYIQDDLMSVLFKQQQEGVGAVENNFN